MPLLNAWIDVEDTSRTIVGSGPLTDFIYFRVKRRMNRAGTFRMVIPATDQKAIDLLALERTVQCYAIINDTKTWLGGGIIQNKRFRKSGNGDPMLEVTGPDIFGELMRSTVGTLDLNDSSGDNNLDDILAELPAYWSSTKTGTTGAFAARFVHETPLNALNQVAEMVDAVFRYETGRTLKWYNTLPSTSKVTLISYGELGVLGTSQSNTKIALITDIQEQIDSSEIVNTVYAYGSGNGEARISLEQIDDGTHVWPDDSTTLDTVADYSGSYSTAFDWDDTNKNIREENSVSTYGARVAAVQFNEISPVANTDADFNKTMNTLIKQTVHYIERRCEPTKTYSITAAGLAVDVYPGDIVTVDARFYRDGELAVDINNVDLTVLETETLIDEDGARIVEMTLAERRKYPRNDGEIIARTAVKTASYQSYPQMAQYTNTTTYKEPIDDNHSATLYFWVADEITFIDRVYLRYRVTPFDSMMGFYSGGDSHTAYTFTASTGITVSNHSSVNTNSQGSNATDNESSHTHSVTTAPGTTGPGSAHSHDFIHTHTINSITHTVNETAHRHTIPWAYVDEDGTDTYNAGDLEFSVNGGAYAGYDGAITGATGWYYLDVTSDVRNALTLRPTATGGYNYIACRIKAGSAASKSCQIVAQIATTVRGQALSTY